MANVLDRLIAPIAPARALRRAQARQALRAMAYYEAADNTRLRKRRSDTGSGDTVVSRAGRQLRALARHLDENHDLARGVLNTLVASVVGPTGIVPEPQPRRADGTIHEAFAQQLIELWRDWSITPEVTWEHDWPTAQRLAARTWLRDGEVLVQHLEGRIDFLDHGTRVPYSLELIEPDLLPLDYHDAARGITSGVERNAWGRPRNYHLYRQHPGDLLQSLAISANVRAVPAERITHLKMVDRIRQARGVSIFASVLTRLDDLKDYEESERVAAKVAASSAAMIIKGTPDDYAAANPDSPTDPDLPRQLTMRPGMIFDDLRPGERVETIAANRPNPIAELWRSGQLRAVSSGTGAGFSSVSRQYEGTYNARRQEMVEAWTYYDVLQSHFVAQFVRPTWQRFVRVAIAAGLVQVPADVLADTADDALYQGPVMPALDPLKEVNAYRERERAGYASGPQIIRAMGDNPREVMRQEANWRKQAAAAGLVLDADPANDLPGAVAPATDPATDPNADPSVDPQSDPVTNARYPRRAGAAHAS